MADPVLLGPGEGERRQARGSVMDFKALAATTGGRFSLMERSLPREAQCRRRTGTPAAQRRSSCSKAT